MTDRELLELAAKAAWLPWDQWVEDGDDSWNSLEDDGDALRLAITLCFSVIQYMHSVEIMIGEELIHRELSNGNMTRIELTRRAITRAAAAIQLSKERK